MVPGEVIKVLKKADDGWWFGNKIQPVEQKGGWFPSNFTFEPPEPDSLSKTGALRYAKTEFEYVSREEDELHLVSGDLITVVVSEEDQGWHRGVCNGRLGLFPANFVTMISKSEFDKLKTIPHGKSNVSTPPAASTHINDPQKSSQSSLAPQERRASLALFSTPKAETSNGTKRTILSKAMVIYDYIAQQPDELSLTKGMKLDVLEKDDEGWWTGLDDKGRIGVFPFNFVKEIALPVSNTASDTVTSSSSPSSLLKQSHKYSSSKDGGSGENLAKSSSASNLFSKQSTTPASFLLLQKSGELPQTQIRSPASVKIIPSNGSPPKATSPPPIVAPKPTFNKIPFTPQNVAKEAATRSSNDGLNSPPPPINMYKPVLKFAMPGLAKTLSDKSKTDLNSSLKQSPADEKEEPQYMKQKQDVPRKNEKEDLSEGTNGVSVLTHPTKSRPSFSGRKRPTSIIQELMSSASTESSPPFHPSSPPSNPIESEKKTDKLYKETKEETVMAEESGGDDGGDTRVMAEDGVGLEGSPMEIIPTEISAHEKLPDFSINLKDLKDTNESSNSKPKDRDKKQEQEEQEEGKKNARDEIIGALNVEMRKFRDEMDERFRREREGRVELEKEMAVLKRLVDKLLHK